jgi:hypothetical protein
MTLAERTGAPVTASTTVPDKVRSSAASSDNAERHTENAMTWLVKRIF